MSLFWSRGSREANEKVEVCRESLNLCGNIAAVALLYFEN
jgi:hypothetical protein